IVDVMVIAGLFVIRAAAGAEAVDVRISPWLLLCTPLLPLFLALAKRRGELVVSDGEETPGRKVLAGYSLPLVDQLITVVAATTVGANPGRRRPAGGAVLRLPARFRPAGGHAGHDPVRRLRPVPVPASDPPGRPR